MKTLLKNILKLVALIFIINIVTNLTIEYNAAVKAQEAKTLVRAHKLEKLTEKLQEITIDDTYIQLDKLPEYRDL